MKFVQGMGLMVLIALGVPAPKLTAKWTMAIHRSEALGAKAGELVTKGIRLEDLPVVPLAKLEAGAEGIVCDEVRVERGFVPACLGDDAVYLEMR